MKGIWRILLPLAALALAGCGRQPQSMLDPAGPVAGTQLDLLKFDLIAVFIVGLIVVALILYVAIRFRARPGDDSLPPQTPGNRKLEIGWTLLVAAILVPVALEPVRATFWLAEMPTGPDVVNVRVVGHQWWWEFEYPDHKIVTANELHIPVGKKINLSITSRDVIHSFWVPRLGGKVDALPGRVNALWLEAAEAGEYLGQCAELCGTSHANMRFKVIAQPQGEWDAWVRQRQKPVVVSEMSPLAQEGWKAFNDKGCIACHAINGTTAKGKVGPNLTGLGSRTSLAAAIMDNSPEDLAAWLRDPQALKPRTFMPKRELSEPEIKALVEFLLNQK